MLRFVRLIDRQLVWSLPDRFRKPFPLPGAEMPAPTTTFRRPPSPSEVLSSVCCHGDGLVSIMHHRTGHRIALVTGGQVCWTRLVDTLIHCLAGGSQTAPAAAAAADFATAPHETSRSATAALEPEKETIPAEKLQQQTSDQAPDAAKKGEKIHPETDELLATKDPQSVHQSAGGADDVEPEAARPPATSSAEGDDNESRWTKAGDSGAENNMKKTEAAAKQTSVDIPIDVSEASLGALPKLPTADPTPSAAPPPPTADWDPWIHVALMTMLRTVFSNEYDWISEVNLGGKE